MSRHLLDTDAVIDVLKGVRPTIGLLQSLVQQGAVLCSCDVVIAEVYAGVRAQERAPAETFLATLEFLPTTAAAARQAGEWREDSIRQGQTLPLTDCLIAAVAATHQATVVTGNVRHYPHVPVVPLPR
jgi:tRNA(fMet)-specific endonuclease VapC